MEAAENATAAVVVKEEENADVEAAVRSHYEEAGEAAERRTIAPSRSAAKLEE